MKIFNMKTADLLTLSTLFGITVFLWFVNLIHFVFKNHLTLSIELMVILGESAFIILGFTYASLLSLLPTIKTKQEIIETQKHILQIKQDFIKKKEKDIEFLTECLNSQQDIIKKQKDDIESKQKNIEILREYIESKKI